MTIASAQSVRATPRCGGTMRPASTSSRVRSAWSARRLVSNSRGVTMKRDPHRTAGGTRTGLVGRRRRPPPDWRGWGRVVGWRKERLPSPVCPWNGSTWSMRRGRVGGGGFSAWCDIVPRLWWVPFSVCSLRAGAFSYGSTATTAGRTWDWPSLSSGSCLVVLSPPRVGLNLVGRPKHEPWKGEASAASAGRPDAYDTNENRISESAGVTAPWS